MARVLIGTSGYSYPHWRGVLYPSGLSRARWLEAYATRFPIVELNVTFYRLPEQRAWSAWRTGTPAGFRFAIKGWRAITHYRRLRECEALLSRLAEGMGMLKEKAEVVLWQLPPTLRCDRMLLEGFCDELSRRMASVHHAFEFRHGSWFSEEISVLLAERSYAICVAHSPAQPPRESTATDFVYLRLHQGEEGPNGAYGERELQSWAERIHSWSEKGCDVYAFFNNDFGGWAVRNAETLMGLVAACAPTACADSASSIEEDVRHELDEQ